MDLQTLIKRSEPKLVNVHPTVREKAIELIGKAHAAGIDILITQGYRSIESQNELYAQGRTKPGKIVTNASGGYSYHNYGLAIDFAVYASNGRDINWIVDHNWMKVGEIGESLGLSWGGRWVGFKDYPHFEYTFGLSLAQLRAGAKPPMPSTTLKQEEDDEPMKLEQWQKDLIISGVNKWSKVVIDGNPVISSPDYWVKKVNDGELTAGDLSTLTFAIVSRAVK